MENFRPRLERLDLSVEGLRKKSPA